MLGNRTRSAVALTRHQAATVSQNVAASIVRAASDAAVNAEATEVINGAVLAQQSQISDLDGRVGNLEDIP